jgi:hypothetical protein
MGSVRDFGRPRQSAATRAGVASDRDSDEPRLVYPRLHCPLRCAHAAPLVPPGGVVASGLAWLGLARRSAASS